MLGEEFVHACPEVDVTLAEDSYFIGRDALAPFEAFANGWGNMLEVAGVDARRFPCLDRREDAEGVGPPVDIDDRGTQPE